MKYKVKLSYPTIIVINGGEYALFPDKEIELPDADIVETYVKLKYLEPIQVNKKNANEEVNNAS